MQETAFEKLEQTPKAEKFNFSEIGAIKEDMISLCRKMKEAIDQERYTAIVSDEVGGRIPTLILRKVMKKLHPDQELKTLFVAAGQKSDLPDYENQKDGGKYKELVSYLKKAVGPDDYVLLVTQLIYTGLTIQKLSAALSEAGYGCRGLDVAATTTFIEEKELEKGVSDSDEVYRTGVSPARRPVFARNIFVGREASMSTDKMEDKHRRLTGVAKEKNYNPSPILFEKYLEKYGKDWDYFQGEELRELQDLLAPEEGEDKSVFKDRQKYSVDGNRKEELESKILSDDERRHLRQDIIQAREDVNTLAQAILKEVWGL